jgi:preprotein translocase subunit SecA
VAADDAVAGQNGGARRGARARRRGGQPGRDGQPGAGGQAGRGGQPGRDSQPAASASTVNAPGLARPQQPGQLSYSAPSVDGGAQVQRHTETRRDGEFGKVGRNAPCPCGSGKKYKLCHGDPRNRPVS